MMSIIFGTLIAPAVAARDPHPRRGLWRMLLFLLAFNALYAVYVSWIHTALFIPTRW